MKGVTWSRNSHGLFDYESRHIVKSNMHALTTCSVRRNEGNELFTRTDDEHCNPENDPSSACLEVVQRGGKFFIKASEVEEEEEEIVPETGQKEDNSLWVVVRSLKRGSNRIDYRVREKDTLKFGRIKFKVLRNWDDNSEEAKEINAQQVQEE